MVSKAKLSAQDLNNLDDSWLLTPGEVAGIFRVDPKTVTRWAATIPARGGVPERPPRIGSIRTIGGHRRFKVGEVKEALARGLSSASE